MPTITRFSPRLEKALRHISEKLGRPFVVRTNPVLYRFEESVPVSFAMCDRHERYGSFPIYVHPSPENVHQGELTRAAEYHTLFDAATYLSYIEGYRKPHVNIFSVSPEVRQRFGVKASARISHELTEMFDNAFVLGNSLIANSIVESFGYDPASDFYEERMTETIKRHKDTYSDQKLDIIGHEIGVDIREHPAIAKLMVFAGLIRLATVYLHLPEHLREELLRNIGPLWREHLNSMLDQSGLDLDYRFLRGPDFDGYYTPQRHQKMFEGLFGFLAGAEGYVDTRFASVDEMDGRNVDAGNGAFEADDFNYAFHYFDSVMRRDVALDIKRSMKAMRMSAYARYFDPPLGSEIPFDKKETLMSIKYMAGASYSEERALDLILIQELTDSFMLEAAISFQERVFGPNDDLDNTYRMEAPI